MRTTYQTIGYSLLCLSLAWSCKLADLRPTTLKDATPNRETKAVQLLEACVAAHGLTVLDTGTTYHMAIQDRWKGIYKMMNPLPYNNQPLDFRLQAQNFESQATYLHRSKRAQYGIHNLKTYQINADGERVYRQKNGHLFGWAALHYLLVELPSRLYKAPILKYAGQKTVDGIAYDLVLATWESVTPNKTYDQYLIYIHPDTKRLDRVNYTIRGFKEVIAIAPRNLYGSAQYDGFTKDATGVVYAKEVSVYINDIGKSQGWAHQVTVDSFWLAPN